MSGPSLPLLAERRAELETCGYCPKLCRAACPVSNVEASDTLTPWGKMSLSWFASRGDVSPDAGYAATAWACTGCLACRERCDHRNPVADTLYDARADFSKAGLGPKSARAVVDRQAATGAEASRAVAELAAETSADAAAETALLLGCSYVRKASTVARDAIAATRALAGPCRLVEGCCGAPLLYAGDREGFDRAQKKLMAEVGDAKLVVVDPGCAGTLSDRAPTLLVDLAARHLSRLGRVAVAEAGRAVRWHDPCQLGRGLGRYEQPRAILSRVLGRPADEFDRNREQANCSGAGGLLPLTMAETSRSIADARAAEHRAQGGGVVVTACAQSLRRLRSVGVEVLDLSSILSRALDASG